MKWLTEIIGILFCIQGIGGAATAMFDGSPSWFLVRHVLPDGLQIPAGIVLALLGAAVLAAGSRSRQKT